MGNQTNYSKDGIRKVIDDHFPNMGVLEQVNAWLARGDGIAVYQNHDMSSANLGEVQLASYGSADAQIENQEPPQKLPDIGGRVNWRYQLIGTYKGETL